MYYAVRVTMGQEKIVADTLSIKAAKLNLNIYSIGVFDEYKGYIVVEADDEPSVQALISKERNVKGFIKQPLKEEDIADIFHGKLKQVEIGKGDLVELISGPFRGFKGKVVRVDNEKGSITVELIDVAVPIPVNTEISSVKLEQKAEAKGEEEEKKEKGRQGKK